ncbi:MAG: alcohol dehydrogenase, partial [Candidatus Dormiibacterota bacterium]
MRALITTGDNDILRLAEVPDPVAGANEVLVRVQATSLNRGEVVRAKNAPAGQQVGWDVVGVVERPAGSGGGPAAGTTVVGLVS